MSLTEQIENWLIVLFVLGSWAVSVCTIVFLITFSIYYLTGFHFFRWMIKRIDGR
ncbi:hypothetical protein 031MP004_61 [Bacillus phage 031MP004]|nr:hypothetical protein 022DV001_60 [Bacillus phage 022DV001]QFG05490.1 hypothetical protein 031MP003_63 [Bacillus phage 031MP003]QFG05578.1 hypothetical protein 031MP002_62 [Bacillus phage 031MP002]QFG05638.1 hypothetical protein 031MP004_61 [Bacillus phage 031MP004]QFG05810.1 hypothetical protein 055SW001_60 [Bacillus phage 055SW001]